MARWVISLSRPTMGPAMTPDTLSEVFWVLLTLTALPPDEAMTNFVLDTPTRDDPRCRGHSSNPLGQLDRALIESYIGWWDNFAPDCKAAESLEALCWEMGRTASTNPPGPFCREEFLSGDSWKKARELAREALREADMEPWPLTEKINFNEYIEIVDPEDCVPPWRNSEPNVP